MPASERVPAVGDGLSGDIAAELLAHGELTVRGRLRDASNAVLYCAVEHEGVRAHCVYKPVAGERPLWDFPDGTLAQREVAAYLVSEATGWGLVPPTVLRDGPYGEGMVQLWIETPRRPAKGSSPSSRGTNRATAGRPSASPRWARAAPRCWCTPTTPGCVGWPSWTP